MEGKDRQTYPAEPFTASCDADGGPHRVTATSRGITTQTVSLSYTKALGSALYARLPIPTTSSPPPRGARARQGESLTRSTSDRSRSVAVSPVGLPNIHAWMRLSVTSCSIWRGITPHQAAACSIVQYRSRGSGCGVGVSVCGSIRLWMMLAAGVSRHPRPGQAPCPAITLST